MDKTRGIHLKLDHLEKQNKQRVVIKQADVLPVFSTERILKIVSNGCSIDIILSPSSTSITDGNPRGGSKSHFHAGF